MKYWFFAALLANVVFFLWEFHYGAFELAESPGVAAEKGERQILMVSEVAADAGLEQRPAPEAEPEQTVSPSSSPAEAEAVALPEVPAVEQRPANVDEGNAAPADSAVAPVLPAPKQTNAEKTAATASPAVPENTPMPLPEQVSPSEQSAAQGGEEATAPPESAPPQPPKAEMLQAACFAAGPVENREAFEALLDSYRPQLSALEFSVKEKRKNGSYIVYYPAAATIEEAEAHAEMLKNNYGISDLLLFRDGELKGAISLGVFSNEQRAKTAQSQFEKKGLHAEIRPRYPAETYYSVRTRWNEQQAAAAERLSDALKKRYPSGRALAGCE